jgi:hypothetical protein
MASIFKVNVYNINSTSVYRDGTPVSMGFSPANCVFSAAPANTVSAGNVPLYGIVSVVPSGLQINATSYTVVETVAQLQTLANA